MRKGLNLVEILVAMAVVGALFLPIFTLLRSGVRTTKYTEDRLRALTIAQQQIQTIRHAVSINRESLDRVVRTYLENGGFESFPVEGRYQVYTEIEPDFVVRHGSQEAYVTKAVVLVEWELSGKYRSLILETLLDRTYE